MMVVVGVYFLLELCRAIILAGNHQLSLPVHSFITLIQFAQLTAHEHS
jgi:hypothetical protein